MEAEKGLWRGTLTSAMFLAACATSVDADPGMKYDARIRGILDDWVSDSRTPGLQYLLVGPDGIIFEHRAGYGDLESRTPLGPDSMFSTYSLTKTFTAAAVLRLVEQGKVGLEDELVRHLPEAPYGRAVRIHHLLSQTSGVPNPIPLRWVHLAGSHGRFDEEAALREVLDKNPKLAFEPGERYGYSNISYWLLGKVIESASGKSYGAFMREEIFAPLGAQAEYSVDADLPTGAIKGYLPKWSWMNLFKAFVSDSTYWGDYCGDWLHVRDHFLNGPAFGGVVASGRGIARFLQDQLAPDSVLLSREMRKRFLTQARSNGGDVLPMTLGWHVDTLEGAEYLYKEGGGMGFHAEMRIYPSLGFGSVILVNSGSFNSRKSLSELDRLFANQESP
jgi:D-alanyl-D-alanine carboxypeptidase